MGAFVLFGTTTIRAVAIASGISSMLAAGIYALAAPTTSLNPVSATLPPLHTEAFTATIAGIWNTAVTWSLSSALGIISAAGFYTAPVAIANPQTVKVTATSVADSTKAASAIVTLTPPVIVAVTPGNVVLPSQTEAFTATVSGVTNNTVTWSLSPAVGSISAAGLYTAPESISFAQTVIAKATSMADHTKAASASVELSPSTREAYYISNLGSDSNRGTSPGSPWMTIAHVNAHNFKPGDFILFQAGGTWREQLNITWSGSAALPLTFGSYGNGVQPIISGADLLTDWSTSANTYYVSAASNPMQVFMNGARLVLAPSKAAMIQGTWWWDSAHARVYTYDKPSAQVEASARTNAVKITGESHITLIGLHTTKAQADGILITGVSSYFVQTGLLSDYNFGSGASIFAAQNSGPATQSGLIQNSTLAYNGEKGIASAGNVSGLLIQGNAVHNNCQDNNPATWSSIYCGGINLFSDALGPGGTPLERPKNVNVQNNLVYSNGIDGNVERGHGIWFDSLGAGSAIRYNLSYYNSKSGIQLEYASDAGASWTESVTNNISYSNTFTGIALSRHSHNSVIANNTTWDNYIGILVQGDQTNETIGMENNVISNNISFGATGFSLYVGYGGQNDGANGSGNIYSNNGFGIAATHFIQWGSGVYQSTYPAWEIAAGNCGTVGCSHSVEADPLLDNPSTGVFTLRPDSPAIGSGINLGSSYDLALLPGSTWPGGVFIGAQSLSWNLGAYLCPP